MVAGWSPVLVPLSTSSQTRRQRPQTFLAALSHKVWGACRAAGQPGGEEWSAMEGEKWYALGPGH